MTENFPFGGQRERQRESRSGVYVHKCDGCGESFWSDEAASQHYIGDAIMRLANVIAQSMAEKEKPSL